MTQIVSDDPRERAISDWSSHHVAHLVVGTVDISRPAYHPGDLFYAQSLGCCPSSETEYYCRRYNQTIRSFLERYGIPSWVPAKRLPDAASCLDVLGSKPSAWSTYQPLSGPEEMVINRILPHWGAARPLLFSRLPQQAILMFGGAFDQTMGRLDVVDYLDDVKWMATYMYPRQEYVRLPWDAIAAERSGNL